MMLTKAYITDASKRKLIRILTGLHLLFMISNNLTIALLWLSSLSCLFLFYLLSQHGHFPHVDSSTNSIAEGNIIIITIMLKRTMNNELMMKDLNATRSCVLYSTNRVIKMLTFTNHIYFKDHLTVKNILFILLTDLFSLIYS